MKSGNVVPFAQRSQRQNQQTLERLIAEHRQALRAFLRVRMYRLPDDQEDVEHDVFVRLASIENLHEQLLPEPDKVRSFIIKVANNLILDLERRRQTRQRYLEQYGDDDREADIQTTSPEAAVQATRDLERVQRVLLAMKPEWRDAFILHRFGNRSYHEIARQMAVSAKQVEHYIKQAVIRLNTAAKDDRSLT